MRAFIGIEFSKGIKNNIIKVQNLVRQNSVKGRWKYIDNFHLTIKFLGEISQMQSDGIYDSLMPRVKDTGSFNITMGGLGYFRGQDSLRVVYLSIKDETKNLDKIFKVVEDSCYAAGIQKEKRAYMPHITIAQDVVLKGDYSTIEKQAIGIAGINTPVCEISLIKSEQIDGKRIYTPVWSLKLKNGGDISE